MNKDIWASHFAARKQDNLISIPNQYRIHKDFLYLGDEEEIRSAFSQIHILYFQILKEIEEYPEDFGMPIFSKDEFRIFSQQCRDSEQAILRPFMLLYNLFTCGRIVGQSIVVSVDEFKAIRPQSTHSKAYTEKILNANLLFKKLSDYGFIFEGLKNNKPFTQDIVLSYPDNTLMLFLWKTLADKAKNIHSVYDFLLCSFRLLQDDMKTKNYDELTSFVDTFPLKEEQEFVRKMDETLISIGMVRGEMGSYFHNENLIKQKGPCSFRLFNINTWDPWTSEIKPNKLLVGLRIRNAVKCQEYLKDCPDSVKRIFTEKNDPGCQKHKDNTCIHGVGYELDGKTYWHCGCCNPPFCFMEPKIEDIPYYLNLVKLGEKR